MKIYLILSMFMMVSGLFVFISKRKHMLSMLLSLEFLVLCLYFNMFLYLNMMNLEYFFLMIFITMSVCEGVLSLSIMVSMIRNYGNDNILSLNFLW
uniref:NADH-ubiquinone oxidoreductase chain 4L n=1 Tax=Cucujoidea sp. 3 KM-2017 TaxID=2219367 RepID=A0A346RH39_9CUCU|nr:NADH dehydrogenase subunit 4L [Cucujoidea sp. 3 KM-2017]